MIHTLPARVCVEQLRKSVGHNSKKRKPQEGKGVRFFSSLQEWLFSHSRTTTNYILRLYCSSKGRENNLNLTFGVGGRDV